MDENVAKLIEEQLPNVDHLKGEFLRLAEEEEERLRTHLDKLKKENFALRGSIKAWQTTLETKLDEFKKAELKLEELHKEIWSERDTFCSKLDEFNEEYGILSDWWEMEVRFVTEPESSGEKSSEDEEETENLEKEVEELKQKIEELEARNPEAQTNPGTAEEDSTSRNESKTQDPIQGPKQVNFSEVVEEHYTEKKGGPSAYDLYSLVDFEMVKIAKRRRKNNIASRDKNGLQTPLN